MNIISKLHPTYHHRLKSTFAPTQGNNAGFTLIELLVVVIVVGILTAISLPAYFKQVGKARNVELQTVIGTINRAQQAYHFETQEFAQGADDDESLELLGINISPNYIDNNGYNIVANPDSATAALVNSDYQSDGTKAYSGTVFFIAGSYNTTACVSLDIIDTIAPPASPSNCGANDILQ
jgi:prepilin-type N-terminal cleavage/methylation domain-containing protein